MSSIKDLLDEEKGAERQLRDAENEAETILKNARAKAAEMIRTAQSDDALVRELTEQNKERIAAARAKIMSDCQAKAAETEKRCGVNLEAAVRLIVNEVLGVEIEWRSA